MTGRKGGELTRILHVRHDDVVGLAVQVGDLNDLASASLAQSAELGVVALVGKLLVQGDIGAEVKVANQVRGDDEQLCGSKPATGAGG